MITIVIGGDVCPTGRIQNAFIEGSADAIFHDLLDDVTHADLSIVNLECPLVSHKTPIAKSGPVLGADVRCIQGFAAADWNILNLANNHSFDHGASGLRETIHTIEAAGLAYIGAGSNIEEAQKPCIQEMNGERIVIYSMAEREFSIADETSPGSNPFDLINCIGAIRQYKQDGIFIALIHGGKEFYSYPSPEMVRKCRFMIDMGADAVICCHTHCPLPWEIYAGRPIIYGLGNFIFEPLREAPASWYEGYLARLTVGGGRVCMEAIPYVQSFGQAGVRKMNDVEQKRFTNEMNRKNIEVQDVKFLAQQWRDYCHKQKSFYLEALFGCNRLMRKVHSMLQARLYSKRQVLRALNLVQCETHQEVLNTIFKYEKETSSSEFQKIILKGKKFGKFDET